MAQMVKLIQWLFLGALAVLVVTHASGFATAVQAVGGEVRGGAKLLTGNP